MISKSSISQNEPFLLRPAFIEKLWGGNHLKKEFNKNSIIEQIAETWECSTHPDGESIIASGNYKGKTLWEMLISRPELFGRLYKNRTEFPFLIKLIDATQKLSIQVHPDDNYANKYENGSRGKVEMWYILEAKPDSKLIFGLNHKITRIELEKSIIDGTVEKYLQVINVKKGDVFFLEPGTIHAIGSGIVLAEIQENSNITYRLYDYDRTDKNGSKRELHLKKALDVAKLEKSQYPRQPMKVLKYTPGYASETLGRCKYFLVERVLINSYSVNKPLIITSKDFFTIYLCIEGKCNIIFQNKHLEIQKGDCVFFPVNTLQTEFLGKAEFIKVIS